MRITKNHGRESVDVYSSAYDHGVITSGKTTDGSPWIGYGTAYGDAPDAKGAGFLNNTCHPPQCRADLERRMREVASDPESSFPERLEAVLQHFDARGREVEGGGGSRAAPEYLMRPEPCDRIMAFTLFFQVAGFVRMLTPQMLARFPDDEIAVMALCLGLDADSAGIAGQENHNEGGPRNE
jgi:hypothetical protein